jgi:hypothetical protein
LNCTHIAYNNRLHLTPGLRIRSADGAGELPVIIPQPQVENPAEGLEEGGTGVSSATLSPASLSPKRKFITSSVVKRMAAVFMGGKYIL